MNMHERCDAYARSECGRRFPESIPRVGHEQGRDVLYAIWLIGNDYRNPSKYYGAYPKGYLDRVAALFPDVDQAQKVRDRLVHTTLHAFSGSLPEGPYDRCDSKCECDFLCSVYDLPKHVGSPRYRLVYADPPYSRLDAEVYGTPMIDRRKSVAALAEVTISGGYLCWLDICWPMHSKTQWLTVGRIFIQRSTNHRVRLLSIFQRV